jgi:hypothetical protein
MEYARLVVWPREAKTGKNGKPIYRYPVVGMIVTDKPIQSLEGKNEVLIDGQVFGMAAALDAANQRQPKLRLSTADGVLTGLDEI